MHRDDVRDALDAVASQVPVPDTDAAAAMTRGRRRVRQRRLMLAGVVALLALIVVGAGAIARTGKTSPRVASVPNTPHSVEVIPQTTSTTKPRTTLESPSPIPLAFVSATEGWLCADPVQYTSDAGRRWKNIRVPAAPVACAAIPGGESWLVTASMEADRVQLIHLTHGGRDIETHAFPQVPSGYAVDELSFADSLNGWAHATDHTGGNAGLLTRDGGRTWELGGNSIGVPRFGSATDGWAPAGGAELAHTTDGGFSWQDVPVPAPDPASTGVVDIRPVTVDDDLVVAQGSNSDGHRARLFFDVSTDGGRTWNMRSGPPDLAFPSDLAFPPDRVAPFSATDAEHWQLGSSSQLWSTADAGGSWTMTAEFAGISQITAVDFVTPEIGFVAATGAANTENATVVLQTGDGGETWSTAAIQSPPMSDDGPINFPGGIVGCPTHPLAKPPGGDPPAGLLDAARRYVGRGPNGWVPTTTQHVYRVGENPPNSFGYLFEYHVASCGPSAVAASWVVEMSGTVDDKSYIPRAELALAYSPDGWHVFGRYH